jgi:tetratricopeptide (TPR) repeat protein
VPAFVAAAHNGLARIWLDLGQLARARQHLQQALERSPVPAWSQATTHLLGARLAFEQSQRDAAGKAIGLAEAIGATRFPVRAQARLLAGRLDAPAAAYRDATSVALEAGRLQVHGVRMDALACAARLALALGQPVLAATHAAEAVSLFPEHRPDSLYIGEVWLAAVESLEAAGDPRADEVLAAALAWIRSTTREHVAGAFRDSFLNRNVANRSLLAREGRSR